MGHGTLYDAKQVKLNISIIHKIIHFHLFLSILKCDYTLWSLDEHKNFNTNYNKLDIFKPDLLVLLYLSGLNKMDG